MPRVITPPELSHTIGHTTKHATWCVTTLTHRTRWGMLAPATVPTTMLERSKAQTAHTIMLVVDAVASYHMSCAGGLTRAAAKKVRQANYTLYLIPTNGNSKRLH